jgi:hypothetical protein
MKVKCNQPTPPLRPPLSPPLSCRIFLHRAWCGAYPEPDGAPLHGCITPSEEAAEHFPLVRCQTRGNRAGNVKEHGSLSNYCQHTRPRPDWSRGAVPRDSSHAWLPFGGGRIPARPGASSARNRRGMTQLGIRLLVWTCWAKTGRGFISASSPAVFPRHASCLFEHLRIYPLWQFQSNPSEKHGPPTRCWHSC